MKIMLQSQFDARDGSRHFARHEVFATQGAFVVEQNAATRVQAERFAIGDRQAVRIQLGRAVRIAWRERRRFA